jgi:alpha-L-rhamnosidase
MKMTYRSHCLRTLSICALLVGSTAVRANSTRETASVHIVEQAPQQISLIAPGTYLVDFGRVAFGNLSLSPPTGTGKITVRFGEALKSGRVDTHPPGSVRYAEVSVDLHGTSPLVIAPPPDPRNTTPPAVLTPASWGVLTPFRWIEIEGWSGKLQTGQIRRRAAFDSTWSDDAATFHSSDPVLDRIWDLSHYSIKATTFAGIFVDGDRERISYEADAYLDQLGYYAGDTDPRMPRATFDRLMKLPTWPSEWAPQMIFIAYADWMQTGDRQWLRAHYDGLKTRLLSDRVGPNGLVMSSPKQIRHGDIVDWPSPERDGYVFTGTNTVVNAFHLRALDEMVQLARALGKTDEANNFSAQKEKGYAAFQSRLFDPMRGLYRDGVGTDHTSLHASLFPLAFGLVPEKERRHIAQWLAGRGMAASPYAAQFLLEGLFENGEESAALGLMTAPGDRSWRHMVDSGTTITWEAWDQRYKPNQDWNHAWGAAPANLLPRFVLGAQPLTSGWDTVSIQPHPGNLLHASGTVPTPHGPLSVSWKTAPVFTLQLGIPAGMTARIEVPAQNRSNGIWISGRPVEAHRNGSWWVLEKSVSGTVEIEVR